MKCMKRIVAALLCMVLLTGTCAAEDLLFDREVTEGDFLFNVTPNGSTSLRKYLGSDTDVVIPAKLSTGETLTQINGNVFKGADTVVSVTIPATVTTILNNAFTEAAQLTKVTFLGMQTNVSRDAFDIEKLASNPENVDEYGNVYAGTYLMALNAKDGVSRVRAGTTTIPETTHYLGSPKELYLPESLRYMLPTAFGSIPSLKKVHFDDCPVYIDDGAFSDCANIKEIRLSDNTRYVGSGVFAKYAAARMDEGMVYVGKVLLKAYSDQETYKIKKGTTIIAGKAFQNKKHRPFTVELPKSMRHICEYAFQDSYLAHIEFGGTMETIGVGAFYHCIKLVSLSLPEGIKTLPQYIVRSCTNLRYIELPASLKTVKRRAFYRATPQLVLYHGTEAQFKKISISNTSNDGLINGDKLYNFDSTGCDHPIRQNFTILKQSGKSPAVKTQLCMSCGRTVKVYKNKPVERAVDIFKDVQSREWFYNSVDFAYNYDVFKGVTKDKFAPADSVTRGMFVTVLMRLSGTEYSNKKATPFKDVPAGKYYSGAVRWASEMGIVNGVGGGRFAPDDYITREQLCKMVVLYTAYGGVQLYKGQTAYYFADDAKISDWARNYVYICQATGVVNGKENNMFDPQANASRAQVARVLHSLHSQCYCLLKT